MEDQVPKGKYPLACETPVSNCRQDAGSTLLLGHLHIDFRLITLILLLGLAGCQRASTGYMSPKRFAATNTYLESAARDLLGPDCSILRLAEPGMCPGHFDVRPSQITELQSCRILLRFNFQNSIDTKVRRDGDSGLAIVEVTPVGGLCQPDTYLAACRQLAAAFVAHNCLTREQAEARMREIAKRMEGLEQWGRAQIKVTGWKNRPVLTSARQKDFCTWLGLEVVGEFRAADVASVGEIDQAVRAGEQARGALVIANLPEGRRTADALAERLNARVVVFGNFPALIDGTVAFGQLFRSNVRALVKAAGS